MDIFECIKGRRSVRRFSERPVSQEDLLDIVSAASYAPSWKNTQIVRYHIVDNPALIQEIAENGVHGFAFNTKTISNAPILVVLTYVKGICGFEKDGSFTTDKRDKWQMFDAGIAAQTFCLAAHAKQLGTVILGIYDENMIHQELHLPQEQEIAALIALGHPAAEPEMPSRKTTGELIEFHH